MHRLSALVAAVACACGRHGFEARLAPDAVTADVDASPDSAPDARVPCTGMPFGTPVLLASIATPAQESDPSLASDGLTIYFTSNRTGSAGYAIWTATRATLGSPFGVATVLVDSAATDSEPSISRDGRELFFMSNRNGLNEIFVATRAAPTDPFSSATVLSITGSPSNVRSAPEITADGLGLYYADDLDVAYATRTVASGPFTFRRLLGELNVPQTDGNPTISSDELEIWFDSYRSGPGRTYRATRAVKTDMFTAPAIATDVDTGFAATGTPTLSADDKTLYFYADATGQLDIYAASRACP